MSDDVLTVRKERVLEAAKGCPNVKKALETLFPEAFKGDGPISFKSCLVANEGGYPCLMYEGEILVQGGQDNAVWIDGFRFDWRFERESNRLYATRK